MKLLVAIDSSLVSKTVLDEVARRPWPSGTTACVLHVIDWEQLSEDPSLVQTAKQWANELVKSASNPLSKAGLEVTATVIEGHPRTSVAEYAREWGANMVLIGSHGGSLLVRFLLGSVAQAALRNSPCSVEIVRRPAGERANAMKILIGTDGSDCSMAAVRSVAQRPWPQGSQISLISAVPVVTLFGTPLSLPGAPANLPPELVDTIGKRVQGRAKEAVARARQILSKAHVEIVESDFLPVGDAREIILDQAKQWVADMIVVGSHGYRTIDRFMLGSVSESVAIHANCSVEVIRE